MRGLFRKVFKEKVREEDDRTEALAAKINASILKSAAQESVKEARKRNEAAEVINLENGFTGGLRNAFLPPHKEETD